MRLNTESGELFLYGVVGGDWFGDGFTDGEVVEALSELGDRRATIRINSPGGEVDNGVSIKNALARHTPGVDIVVDALAASSASWIMLAGTLPGNSLRFASGSRVMIHKPWTVAFGDANELRHVANVLDKYEESLVPEYARAMGLDRDTVAELLALETWYTAEEAATAFPGSLLDGDLEAESVTVEAGMFANAPRELVAASADSATFRRFGGIAARRRQEPKEPQTSILDAAKAAQQQVNRRIAGILK